MVDRWLFAAIFFLLDSVNILTQEDTVEDEAAMANDLNKNLPEEDEEKISEELYFGLDFGVLQTLYDGFEEQQVAKNKETRAYLRRKSWFTVAINAATGSKNAVTMPSQMPARPMPHS